MNRSPAALLLTSALAALLSAGVAAAPPAPDDAAIVHVLNRIGFGARPGDIEKVRAIGLTRYIEQQLHPERIADTALNARLQPMTTLTLSSRELAQRYEIPAQQAKREQKKDAASTPDADKTDKTEQRRKDGERQQAALPLQELSQQKIIRAVYSERQLEEVATDFWFNHFNVDARKGPERFLLTSYERDVIRPRVLGSFRDLLGATAKSPAMLFYLDNWMSADPNGPHMDTTRRANPRRAFPPPPRPGQNGMRRPTPDQAAQAKQRPNMPKGLNENYGRELLELHTLGVDGGYTQKDVTEVARAFTGWTIENPRTGGGFIFRPQLHDDGEKIVLGQKIAAGGGERDGERVLDILANHPATARFIATKLARRFVSDSPSPELLDHLAETFTRTKGDLRAVMTALLASPEFLAPDTQRAKVKTPFEFIVSALRTTGAEVNDAKSLVRALQQQLGMPLYQCQPPTGYKDTAEAWVNTGALVNRMNAALAIASGRQPGVRLENPPAPESVVANNMSDVTRATIAKATAPAQALALALGSPEFQRH